MEAVLTSVYVVGVLLLSISCCIYGGYLLADPNRSQWDETPAVVIGIGSISSLFWPLILGIGLPVLAFTQIGKWIYHANH